MNASILAALVYWFDVDYRLANLGGIAAGMTLNFLAGELWVFRGPSPGGTDAGRTVSRDGSDPKSGEAASDVDVSTAK